MSRVKFFAWSPLRYLCALLLVFPLAGAMRSACAATVFAVNSGPLSWIGAGDPILVTPEDGFEFSGYRDGDSVVSFLIHDFHANRDRFTPRWWSLELASPTGSPLSIGAYTGAAKYSFQVSSTPGLNFEGNGRANTAVTGSFEVFELVADADGTILSFAADFLQYDEGLEDWWNQGGLRIHSDRPITWLSVPPVEPPPPDSDPGPAPEEPELAPWWPIGRQLPPFDSPVAEPPLVDSPPATPTEPVPGPLPVAAALAGWQSSRALRRRCRHRR